MTFSWEATQFTVSHYNLMDVTRGDRRINQDPIARVGNNDGTTVHYTYAAAGGQVRGGKRFELEMVLTNGESRRVPVSDE